MNKSNGKGEPKDPVLDLEHELPPASDEGEGSLASVTAEQAEVEQLKSERDVLLDRAARLQAEFDNYRKRQAREQQDFREYALADALKSLLPILDSFERAIVTPGGVEELCSGVELINRQLHDTLGKLGIQPISAEGTFFDPNLHQAIQMVDTEDTPDNQVIEELQRGYKLRDRLLRPAMVRVARNPGK